MRELAKHPGYYVTDDGRVWSDRSAKWLRTPLAGSGYPSVGIQGYTYTVHSLVAEVYLGLRPEGQQVRHLNGDSTDNRVDNLAYGTPSENQLDSLRHGTSHWAGRTHCPGGHAYDEPNTYIDPRGRRVCRACRVIHKRAHLARQGQK